MSKPTPLAITLAALPARWTDRGWMYADTIRANLRLLGFEVTSQQVAATLRQMSRCDAPWVETRCVDGLTQYRVTQWGSNDIDNRWPSVQAHTPWLLHAS